ncbi:MAG: imidazole glycerol phosphate synthase subunit HisH [Andreesenia angusta]|nr:imidazole glycerol phosphate synthase subunit HisH [Andreesenia angusta]
MIGIVDYGVGNLSSIENALNTLKYENKIVDSVEEILKCDGLILPGVGAYRDAIKSLKESGLLKSVLDFANSKKPILGICLGLQLLYEKSYEDGEYEGLGLLKGEVVKFNDDLKVPHMGWNDLIIRRDDEIIKYIEEGEYVYFVHSYYINSMDDVISYSEYGVNVPAVVGKENIYGMQFHPEKSGTTGMKILKAFGELI